MDKLQTRSDQLSGGQQQRVSIARALVQQAPIILADEPVASLDPITTEKVMQDLKNQSRNEKTVIVNLHSVPLARSYSTRVIALKAGTVVFDGVPEALTDERLEQIYGKAILKKRQEKPMKLKETVHFKWYKNLLILLFLILCFQSSAWITGADFAQVWSNSNQVTAFFARFLHPDFSYLPKLVSPMLKTLEMSLVGTVIGVCLAIPVSFLATTVITENRWLSTIFRFLLGLIRTIPNLLLAALFVAIFGIGEATGS